MRNSYRTFLVLFILAIASNRSFSQQIDDAESVGRGKFRKENIFLGTGLNLGFANTSFNVGLNPEVGYSVARWLDAGIAFNLNYFSQNASDYYSYRTRNFNYGGGPFVRLWPISFLYVQAQPELNWTAGSRKDIVSGNTEKYNSNSSSLLVGVGYGTKILGSHYSYFSLMIDVLQDRNSPYRDAYSDPLPVFRAGFGFYLRSSRH